MPSKADLPALGAFMKDLGADLAKNGELAWTRSRDWESGIERPTAPASAEQCRCGHSPEVHHHESGPCTFVTELPRTAVEGVPGELWPMVRQGCLCMGFVAAPTGTSAEDRRDEGKQVAATSGTHAEFVALLADADRVASALRRLLDRLVPANPALGRGAPQTATEVELSGHCSNCWRNDQELVKITIDKRTGKPIFRGLCEWCGRSKNEYGMLPDLPLLQLHHAGRRVLPRHWVEAQARHKAAQPKGKRKKGKRAA